MVSMISEENFEEWPDLRYPLFFALGNAQGYICSLYYDESSSKHREFSAGDREAVELLESAANAIRKELTAICIERGWPKTEWHDRLTELSTN